MMETVSLKGEETFLRIADGDGIFCGGDQAWFDTTVGRHSGCGTVAAADITAYLAQQHPGLRRLYNGGGDSPADGSTYVPAGSSTACAADSLEAGSPVLSKEEFLRHMCELYTYVRPWKVPFVSENRPPHRNFGWGLGIWPPCRFARATERFARSRGIRLRNRRISSRRSMEELTAFIADSLERDCPVAMLIGRKPRYEREIVERPDGFKWMQTHFSMHWVVITMLTKRAGKVMVKVSTWGGYSWLDLEAWHRAGGLMPGLVSFAWTKEV